jgi:hypothetical protein
MLAGVLGAANGTLANDLDANSVWSSPTIGSLLLKLDEAMGVEPGRAHLHC